MFCPVGYGCIMCMLASHENDVAIRVSISDRELTERCADAQ